MKKFLTTLLGKKNKPKAPPSGEAGIPPHLIQDLVDKVGELLPLTEPTSQAILERLATAVQNDQLDIAVSSFLAFTKDSPAVASLVNGAIMASGQFNNFKKEEKDGLLDKQMVRQRKNFTVKQLTGMLGQAKAYLQQQ